MPRPIVAIVPEPERETLRRAGVLPPGFFRGFGEDGDAGPEADDDPSVLLWPHSIDYSAGARLAERMDERPPDIPSFFGIPPGEDDAARMANERLVARLLDGTVVHVVFLERESSRPGYARFGSFAQLTSWSRAFKRALRARFTNEAEFQRMENVLVVVSRGEQAKATKEELDDFRSCFGEGQAFRSCYFLDYTLQAADTRQLFHSALVWDVAVARLLLAFVLSRETSDADGGHTEPFWRKTGIRLWRALECRAVLSPAIRERASASLGNACEQLQGNLGGGLPEAPVPEPPTVDLSSVPPLEPSDGMDPAWRAVPEGGWSDFDASGALVARTEDESRWTEAFEEVSARFSDWTRQHKPDSGRRGIRDRFQGVHSDPRRLFAERRALFGALERDKAESERASAGEDPLAATWDRVAALTKEREDVLLRLRQESKDFSLARKHYAGWGMGMLAAGSVSCLCGWVLFRIVAAIGASSFYAVLFGGATACGALLACGGVLWLHGRSGLLGALACAETSRESDEVAVERDGAVRDLVKQALAVGRRTRLRGQFFRAWALLNRTEQILLTELQPAAAEVALEDDLDADGPDPPAAADPRETFVRLTCRGFGEGDSNEPFDPDLSSSDAAPGGIEDVVRAWWEGPADAVASPDVRPRESFRDLWVRLCSLDVESAGYFPAKTFSREIASFVGDFAEAVRRLASRRARDGNVESFQDKLKGWLSDDVCAVNVNQFASAAFTALHTDDEQRRTGHVWFVGDERIADPAALQNEARLRGHSFQPVVHPSALLSRLPQLGFFFQEFDVGFGIDETEGTGRLVITEASHG